MLRRNNGKRNRMKLQKRDCGIKMQLVPYGGGWTDVYIDFGDGELLKFIISDVMGHNFNDFMSCLYHLYPDNQDAEDIGDMVECKYGICEYVNNKYHVKQIVDDIRNTNPPFVYQDIPWRASFAWNEEGSESKWVIEREPGEDTSFNVKISIDILRDEDKHYEYVVAYKDICYAVADACTKALKKHGFWGYHHAVYFEDMNIRYLLFLKSVALDNFEARELTFYEEKGMGETSDFQKELELLLFDME